MTKHTPGPWRARFHERNKKTSVGDWFFVDNTENPIRLTGVKRKRLSAASNARLIAAAPDMLEALKMAEARLAELAINGPMSPTALSFVRAAIAKATGS